ncbi:hypothetical protein QN277_011066 [Acacia crassicarpa]|uniref:Mediator complex subunit 15 KIX domain-containing protein n=1 Tax=Acacia crassicarpa TaxID=499986 RepID=A0AAE1MAW8_9FABA|nr:hypothetical protein QN277_011066 [Acacia crassicarpa]
MDTNTWRPTRGTEAPMDTSDWRTQLQPDSRQRIVNKMMETLKRHIPFSGQEGLHELRNIAQRFEEKIYTAATSQPDYLRKISLKMLTMETKSHNNMNNNNPMPSNPGGPSNQPTDAGLLQPHVQNPGQSHPMPLPNQPQSHQQILPQNIQNNMAPQSNLSSAANIGQTPMQNLAQNSNMQNMPGQNLVGTTISQNSNMQNMFTGSQRQMPGRQQVVGQQKPQQYLYQQQQLLKQKFQHSHSLMQQQQLQQQLQQQQQQPQLQQNLLQPNQLQSNQQSVMQTSSVIQPSVMPTPSLSGLQQNQQSNNVQSSTQSNNPCFSNIPSQLLGSNRIL